MRFVVVGLIVLGALAARVRAEPVRLAVMELANTSAERALDPLGKGLQSMITTDLAQVASVTLVERAKLADVEGELKLGRSAMVDPATAVKLGKLAGATHLVSGTFAVVGDKMRIDGRIVSVADGRVVLAEQIEGERDAFFELEKALVGKIVGAIGVKLAPKERGAIAKIHTSDFGAFREFSQGVALADDQKYVEAVAALRAAQAKDQDFKLAAVTLAEYEGILARLHARADALETAQADVAAAALEGEARAEMDALERLKQIADRKGGDAMDRLAALYLLATAYGNMAPGGSDLYKLHGVSDRFALRRAAAGYVQRYWAEALPMFPRVLPVVRAELLVVPRSAGEVDNALAKAKQQLIDAQVRPRVECTERKARDARLLCNLDWLGSTGDPVHAMPEWLGLDAHQTAALHVRLYELGKTLAQPVTWRQRMLRGLAEDFRGLGDFGRSTAYFTELAGITTEPNDIRKITREIEGDRAAAAALARATHRAVAVELIGNRIYGQQSGESAVSLAEHHHEDNLYALARDLAWSRQFPSSGRIPGAHADLPIWIGDRQVWVMQELAGSLITGPRSEPFHASAIRYGATEAAGDTLLIVDAVRRRDVRFGVEADFTPPPDLVMPHDEALAAQPAEIGFAFGLRDVWSQAPVRDSRLPPARPSHGYAVLIDAQSVRLDELIDRGETPATSIRSGVGREAHAFDHKTLARQALGPRSAAPRTLALVIAGDQLTITVDGKAFRFAAPADRDGFYGFAIRGAGYVGLRQIK